MKKNMVKKYLCRAAFLLCGLLLTGCRFGAGDGSEEQTNSGNISPEYSENSSRTDMPPYDTADDNKSSEEDSSWNISSENSEFASEDNTADTKTYASDSEPGAEHNTQEDPSSQGPSEMLPSEAEPVLSQPQPTLPAWTGELSHEQIAAINNQSFAAPQTGLKKLVQITYLTGEQVRSYIEAYTVPDCGFYNGTPVTEEKKTHLLKLRNLDVIGASVSIQYGVLTENTPVRSFPVMDTMTKDTGVHAFDYLQETMFKVGEGVVVIHQTADGSFSFVMGENYNGWVKTEKIGFTTYPVFVDWMSGLESPLTVIARCAVIQGKYLRMGTKLPLAAQADGCFTVKFPTQNQGKLEIISIDVPNDGKTVAGYLPLTRIGIVDQADKLVGMPYGWGDTGANMDCSSTMDAIYAAFGITLPRNSSAIPYTGTSVTNVSGMSAAEKEALIRNTKPGTMLVMPGHVVMYIGEKNGVMTIIHNVTTYRLDGAAITEAYQCSKTPLAIYTEGGRSYLDAISYVIQF